YELDKNGTGAWVSLIGDLLNSEVGSVAYDPINDRVLVGTQDTGGEEQRILGGTVGWTDLTGGDGGTQAVGIDGTHIYHYAVSNSFGTMQRQEFNAQGQPVGAPVNIGQKGVGLAGMLDAEDRNPGGFRNYAFVVNAVDHKSLLLGWNDLYTSADNGNTVT